MADLSREEEYNITDIRIIRSRRRRKTVAARLIRNLMYVYVPQNISEEELEKIIGSFKQRFHRSMLEKKLNRQMPLDEIAARLNRQYFKGALDISLIEYVTAQTHKFGCCNYQDKSIRISHRVATMPEWVRDYVVLHEMAHLVEPNHGRSFWNIISCYKLAERAKGYLIAKGAQAEDF